MYGWAGMGASQPANCDFFGVFKPECVCNPDLGFLSWLCTDEWQKAAQVTANPAMIPALRMPAVPVAPVVLPSGNPVDQSPDLPAKLAADAMRRTQVQNQQTVDDYTSAYLSDAGSGGESGMGVPWYVWVAGGLGLFGLVALSAGGPRRYGR